MMLSRSLAQRQFASSCRNLQSSYRRFQSSVADGSVTEAVAAATRPARRSVTPAERATLRAARKERANAALLAQASTSAEASAGSNGRLGQVTRTVVGNRWFWYVAVTLPTGLLVWGVRDEESPPAKFSKWIGLTDKIISLSEDYTKPNHDKLLPEWAHVRSVAIFRACVS